VAFLLLGTSGNVEAVAQIFDGLFAGMLSVGDAATALYKLIVGQPLVVHIIAGLGFLLGLVLGVRRLRRRRARLAAVSEARGGAIIAESEREPLPDAEMAESSPGAPVPALAPASQSGQAGSAPARKMPQPTFAPVHRVEVEQRHSASPVQPVTAARAKLHSPIHRKFGELQRTKPKMLEETPDPVAICKFLNVLTLGISRFYTIPQGCVLAVSAFDRYKTFKRPGLRSILSLWGFYEQPIGIVSSKEIVGKYCISNVWTSDRVQCDIDVMLVYRISDPGKALFEVEDYADGMAQLADYVVREQGGMRRSTELLGANREEMATPMLKSVKSDAQPWGIEVRLFQVTSIVPSGGRHVGVSTI
jgi:hypothetical protein